MLLFSERLRNCWRWSGSLHSICSSWPDNPSSAGWERELFLSELHLTFLWLTGAATFGAGAATAALVGGGTVISSVLCIAPFCRSYSWIFWFWFLKPLGSFEWHHVARIYLTAIIVIILNCLYLILIKNIFCFISGQAQANAVFSQLRNEAQGVPALVRWTKHS